MVSVNKVKHKKNLSDFTNLVREVAHEQKDLLHFGADFGHFLKTME